MRAFIALLITATATQASPCAKHDDFTASLADRFGEVVQVQALSGDGRMMELLANPDTGTWSELMTDINGLACIVGAGDRFQAVKPGQPA